MLSTLYMTEQNVIQINLPQAASSQQDRTKLLAVTITAQGKVLLEQEEIPSEVFDSRIRAELSTGADAAFILRADRQAEYGKVVAVLDRLKRNGASRVAIAVAAE